MFRLSNFLPWCKLIDWTMAAFRSALGVHAARQVYCIHSRTLRQTMSDQSAASLFQGCRLLSTETSTPTPGPPIPPPGFNVNEAKKPIPVERNPITPQEAIAASGARVESSLPTTVTTSPSPQEATAIAPTPGTETEVKEKKDEVKLTLWQKVKREVAHYWDGTKLLGAEIKISWKLALKMAAGYELTRREHRQV